MSCPVCHRLRPGEGSGGAVHPTLCRCPTGPGLVEPTYDPPPITMAEAFTLAGDVDDGEYLGRNDQADLGAWAGWVAGARKIPRPVKFGPDGTFVVMYRGRGRDEARALAVAILRAIEAP